MSGIDPTLLPEPPSLAARVLGGQAMKAAAVIRQDMENKTIRVMAALQPIECVIWRGHKDDSGYGRVMRGGKLIRMHRLVWTVINGPIPQGMLVCHRCDVRACINPVHLFLGSNMDNVRDMVAKGRSTPKVHNYIGATSPSAKLTEAQARRIKCGTEKLSRLADELGVSQTAVGRIRNGKSWRHL